MGIVYPPNAVFLSPRLPLEQTQGGYATHNWRQTVCPNEGGMFTYYHDHPYPRKGHTYPEACEANNIIKKLTVGTLLSLNTKSVLLPSLGFLLLPWKYKIQWLEKILQNYCRMADYVLRNHYLKRKYYTAMGRELWDLTAHFLRGLGITAETSDRVGRIIANLLEHDDAYRLRAQDIFSEMDKKSMLLYPRYELMRLAEIYVSREKSGIKEKFTSIAKILSLVLLVPRIRKAFFNAFLATTIENLRLDEADKYFCRERPDYDYMGEDDKIRQKKFINDYNRFALERFSKMVKTSVKNPEALTNITNQLNAFNPNLKA